MNVYNQSKKHKMNTKLSENTTHSSLIQAIQLTTELHIKASLMALHFHTNT